MSVPPAFVSGLPLVNNEIFLLETWDQPQPDQFVKSTRYFSSHVNAACVAAALGLTVVKSVATASQGLELSAVIRCCSVDRLPEGVTLSDAATAKPVPFFANVIPRTEYIFEATTPRKLIADEWAKQYNGGTSDLCTALAEALDTALQMLGACAGQMQEYSDNESAYCKEFGDADFSDVNAFVGKPVCTVAELYEKYLLECIDASDDVGADSDAPNWAAEHGGAWLVTQYMHEMGWVFENGQRPLDCPVAAQKWLRGLPTACGVFFNNSDIANWYQGATGLESDEDDDHLIAEYWVNVGEALAALVRKHYAIKVYPAPPVAPVAPVVRGPNR